MYIKIELWIKKYDFILFQTYKLNYNKIKNY